MLKNVLPKSINVQIKTIFIVDSKYLYYVLSLKRNNVDKSVRPDVKSMRFYLDTLFYIFTWIAGSLNAADVGTR